MSSNLAAADHPGRSRRHRPLRFVATVIVAVALSTTAVVVALNRLDDDDVVAEQCTAHAGDLAWSLSPRQAQNAALIVGTAVRRELPARAATIGLATALQESRMVNIDYGDRDSLGLFQQRPSQGWGTPAQIMDPVYATNTFYDALITVDGYQQLAVTEAAQAVQRSAFPDAYAQHEDKARAWASALTGYSPATLTCELAPVTADEAAAGTALVIERLDRDLGIEAEATGSTVDVAGGALIPEDPQRGAWAVGQWAVAVADETGVDAVQVGGQRWSRADPTWSEASDTPDAEADTLPPGDVLIEVAAPPTG